MERIYLRKMILKHLFKFGNRADPRLFDKDYLFLSALAKELRKAATSLIVKNATIIDVGSVYKPYMSLFEEKYRNFFSIDVQQYGHEPNIVSSAENLPIRSQSVDVCLCTQVLEHVNDPQKVLDELSRVLKKNGTLLLSTHGVFHHHPYPHDYWRWTAEGLHKIVKGIFSEVTIYPNGGAMLVLFHIIGRGIFYISERVRLMKLLQYTVYPMVNITGLVADKLFYEPSMSINYLVVAKK